MTNQEKNEYRLRFRRFQQSREKFYAPKLKAALIAQYKTVIDNISLGIAAADLIDPTVIAVIINDLYYDAATVYGAKIRADLNRLKARMPIGFSEQMAQLVRDYFAADILNTSLGITETTKDLIRKVFTEAYEKGLSIDDIVQLLQNTELSAIRSRLIARTETVKTANAGADFVAKDSGLVLRKEWLATYDDRTRSHHAHVNGQIVAMDGFFLVGGYEMKYPGDVGGKDGKPKVPVKELANCRCCQLYEPVRENGKLVRV